MSCKIEWNIFFMNEKFSKSFINGEYKKKCG